MKGMEICDYFKAFALKVKSEHGYRMHNKTHCDSYAAGIQLGWQKGRMALTRPNLGMADIFK
jgi:hypothetical protein